MRRQKKRAKHLDSTLRAFNSIYLNSWAIDSSLTPQQKSDIEEIADKCPITHGPGVFRARNMLRSLADTVLRFSNDCSVPDEDEKALKDEEDRKARMEPNPARGHSVLHYELEEKGAELILRDMQGRLLDRLPLREAKGRQNVDLSGYDNGVLLYEVRKDGRRLESGRIMHVR